jgi:hypothetical protein
MNAAAASAKTTIIEILCCFAMHFAHYIYSSVARSNAAAATAKTTILEIWCCTAALQLL